MGEGGYTWYTHTWYLEYTHTRGTWSTQTHVAPGVHTHTWHLEYTHTRGT
jgi:hypothetical protein